MEWKEAVSLVAPVLGVLGLFIGLLQYIKAQRWKRSEFAAKHLSTLSTDPELALCCKLLDWSQRKVPVPEKYRSLTGKTVFDHNWGVMQTALVAEPEKCVFDWQQMLYRDLFDHFFEYLERINHYISIRLISIRDVASLKYWLEQIAEPRFMPKRQRSIFLDFIEAYEYQGVTELAARFGVSFRADLKCQPGLRKPGRLTSRRQTTRVESLPVPSCFTLHTRRAF